MPDLLLHHANFYDPPLDPRATDPISVGQAMLIRDGRIAAVGSLDQVRAAAEHAAQQINLDGRTVIPGLVDCHCHLDGVGQAATILDLAAATSKAQCLEKVRHAAMQSPPGQYILGRGYNVNNWPQPVFPTAADLDAVAANHPVILAQFDGHSIWTNSRAMADAAVTADTPNPPGGAIARGPAGKPTGIFFETAAALIRPPRPTADQARHYLKTAVGTYARFGYTAVHTVGAGGHQPVLELLDMLAELYPAPDCPLRVRGYTLAHDLDQAAARRERDAHDPRFRLAGVKAFADGSLNSHSAWMLAAYEGDPGNCGIPTLCGDALLNLVRRCSAARLPLACHAIGDRAIRELLDAFDHAGNRDLCNRIEHAQHIHPHDIPRFAAIGAIAAMQSCHLIPDWHTADRLLGDRARHSYPIRSLIDAGAHVILGSDAPVVSADPRDSLLAAVWRIDRNGNPPGGWNPQHSVCVAQWLWMHTAGAWLALGEATHRGRLTVGMDADLTVLDQDIFDPTFNDPLGLTIAATILAGQFTHNTL